VMKPKPFAALKNFTIPFAMSFLVVMTDPPPHDKCRAIKGLAGPPAFSVLAGLSGLDLGPHRDRWQAQPTIRFNNHPLRTLIRLWPRNQINPPAPHRRTGRPVLDLGPPRYLAFARRCQGPKPSLALNAMQTRSPEPWNGETEPAISLR
jgi:hypothetical protein